MNQNLLGKSVTGQISRFLITFSENGLYWVGGDLISGARRVAFIRDRVEKVEE